MIIIVMAYITMALDHECVLSSIGSYHFAGESTEQTCVISRIDEHKGNGLRWLSQHSHTSQGKAIASDQSIAVVPVGLHRRRVCCYCFRTIAKKAKQREDCTHLSYCSDRDCLDYAGLYLDTFAALINDLYAPSFTFVDLRDSIQLLLVMLFNAVHDSHTLAQLCNMLSHLQSNYSPDVESPVNQVSLWLAQVLRQQQSVSLLIDRLEAVSFIDFAQPHIICKILAIISLNAQQLPLQQQLPRTSLLTIFWAFSRVNHSCRPNAHIEIAPPSDDQHQRTNGAHEPLNAVLMSNSVIDIGQEITISYIAPLLLPCEQRRAMLRSAFSFECLCERCAQESSSVSKPSSPSLHRLHQQLADFQQLATDRIFPVILGEKKQWPRDTTFKSNVSLSTVVQSALRVLETSDGISSSENLTEVMYASHDAAMIVLEIIQAVKKDTTFGDYLSEYVGLDPVNGFDQHALVVQACYVISQWWMRAGCSVSASHIEYLWKGAQAGAQLIDDLKEGQIAPSVGSHQQEGTAAVNDVTTKGFTMAQLLDELISIHFPANRLMNVSTQKLLKKYLSSTMLRRLNY